MNNYFNKQFMWLKRSMMICILSISTIGKAELIEDSESEQTTGTLPSPQADARDLKQNTAPEAPQQKPRQIDQQKTFARSKSKSTKPGVVKFWSRSLSGFKQQGSLILEEDVVVTQDDIRIEADKATILFANKSNEVKEVQAVGSVKFQRTDPETGLPVRAQGREAVFNNGKRTVVLKGDPVMYRGEDVIRGKVINYDLRNGWVKADRVEGVVQPSQKANSK